MIVSLFPVNAIGVNSHECRRGIATRTTDYIQSATRITGNCIATQFLLQTILDIESYALIIDDFITPGLVGNAITIGITAKAESGARITIHHIAIEQVTVTGGIKTGGLWIELTATDVGINLVAGRSLFDIHTLVTPGIEGVVMDTVIVGLIRVRSRVLAIGPLFKGGADINGFAILATRLEIEIMNATIFKGGVGNF